MRIPNCRLASTLLIAILAAVPHFAAAQGKEKIARATVGENKASARDYKQHFHTKADIEESFRGLKEKGFTAIYWRMLWPGPNGLEWYTYRMQAEMAQLRNEFENTPYAWDPDEIRWPIEVAHRLGTKFYPWIDPHNMGAPPGAMAELAGPNFKPQPFPFPTGPVYQTEFPYMYKFVRENPQYQLVDRKGQRHHYGVMEWAYPEARRYWTDLVGRILDNYNVDGIYMDTRTECMAPDYADQFGFNEPVVLEYQRRYGVDIRHDDFDLENWRQLRGEYFTLFLREMSEVIHRKGKRFSLGTARGDHVGFPLGNLKLEWRKWISEKMIDELHLDERGWAWGRHGYGYLTDPETGRGLQPLEQMVKESYGPLCRKYGVKLYFSPALYVGDNESKQRVAQMPEFDGTVQ